MIRFTYMSHDHEVVGVFPLRSLDKIYIFSSASFSTYSTHFKPSLNTIAKFYADTQKNTQSKSFIHISVSNFLMFDFFGIEGLFKFYQTHFLNGIYNHFWWERLFFFFVEIRYVLHFRHKIKLFYPLIFFFLYLFNFNGIKKLCKKIYCIHAFFTSNK